MAKSEITTNRPARLNDLQRVLLSTACQRESGNLLPVAESIAGKLEAVRCAVPSMLKRGLVAEVEVAPRDQAWREEDDRHIGIVITEVGRESIGGAVAKIDDNTDEHAAASARAARGARTPPHPMSKTAQVIAMLQREEGATLADLVEATGWLPHTTRAALTGLRKKGHAIEKRKRGDAACYRIAEDNVAPCDEVALESEAA